MTKCHVTINMLLPHGVNWLYWTCWCKGSLLLYWRKYIIWGIYINANSLIVCFIPLLYTTMNLFLPSVIVVSSQKLKILLMSNLTKYKISLWSSGGFISSGAEHHVYHGNKQWVISNPSLFISSVFCSLVYTAFQESMSMLAPVNLRLLLLMVSVASPLL